MNSLRCSLFFAVLGLVAVAQVLAHAFLQHSDPTVGGKVNFSPTEVRIWFTEAIEPAFSTIQVFDAAGKQLDKNDTHQDASNHSLLRVSLPPLGPGTYKVVWHVVSVDTHVTKGDFTFQVLR
jgi:methionine-rich copper-binding protein CopC